MIAGLVGAPLATASSALAADAPAAVVGATGAAPAENPYCDTRSGYLCESYGYAPDYVPEGRHHHHYYRHHWHHWY
jgi:hypothetical protein